MKEFSLLLIILSCLICGSIASQVRLSYCDIEKYSEGKILNSSARSPLNYVKLLKADTFKLSNFQAGYVFSLKEHTAKGAVFCRMENLYREKFNVWIKIHAGDW